MARAPLQVLVLPFRHRADGRIEYAVFRRADHVDDCWQGLAGGAGAGESAEQAARREMMEEAGIAADAPLIALDAIAGIAADQFDEHEQWGPEVYIVIERAFAARVPDEFSIAMHCSIGARAVYAQAGHFYAHVIRVRILYADPKRINACVIGLAGALR